MKKNTYICTITMLILGVCYVYTVQFTVYCMTVASDAASEPFSQPEVIDDHNIKVVEMKLENVHIYIHWTHISYHVSCCAAASVFRLSFLSFTSTSRKTSLSWFERYSHRTMSH